MESETITLIPIDPVKRSYYVYYDLSGRIKRITHKYEKSKLEHVVTENPEAGECISGHKNLNHYCVSFNNESDDIEFMHRKNAGSLRAIEKVLFQIPFQNTATPDPDIGIRLYPNHDLLTIELGQSIKKRLTWGINTHDIKNPQGSLLNLYITKKNNPDCLLTQIIIDPIELIHEQFITVEFPKSIIRYVDFKDISIWTCRLFDLYSYKLIDEFVGYDPKDIRRIKNATRDNDVNIKFYRNKNGKLRIKASKDIAQLIPNKNLQFHVVDATIKQNFESRFLKTVNVKRDHAIKGKELNCKVPKDFDILHNYKLKIGIK